MNQNTTPQYYIWTIGCQMNKAESERLGSLLEQKGYRPSASADTADIIVLNSCVVRQHAEDRVINKLHNLAPLKKARPELTLAVTGCFIDSSLEQLKRAFPHVDYFFQAGDIPDWLVLRKDERFIPNEVERPSDAGWCQALPQSPPSSVYVPVIHGCDQFCSYCIVPYRRGRERSRPLDEITAEVAELARRGAKEVILLGQNVDAYGHDLPEKHDLADLLAALNRIDGLARIRFLTSHPRDMTAKLIDAVARLEKVCEQINLPVQSGSDEILGVMRRGYSIEHYRQLIVEIRRKIPGIALSTDIIVGFPGESERHFRQTVDLLAEMRFDMVHVAAYSPRPGTIAARELEDDVPAGEKKRRLNIIEELQAEIAGDINARFVGQTVEVLVDGKEKGKWRGRTRGDKLVFFSDRSNCPDMPGLVDIRIEKASPWSLQGKVESRLIGTE
ncbi:MAG: tRNA (N6-isopentenyl adenosine(37)-C2)-methylthiotransferase MiaB [Chloroflexi bacterium]|nr:tRNA (N6-isopentenyl adenosine(37)-C2)-methylthiotransferase MiaB [Chloroflexota bacterium]